MAQPRFRAAYDFLLLRCQVGEPMHELCNWWTLFQEADEAEREAMVKALGGSEGRKRRRRRRRKPRASRDGG